MQRATATRGDHHRHPLRTQGLEMVAVFIDMTAQAGGLIVTMTPADPDTSVSAANMTSSTTVADALPPPNVGYVFTLFLSLLSVLFFKMD